MPQCLNAIRNHKSQIHRFQRSIDKRWEFGLSPRDPATLLGAVAITGVAAVLATAIPLLRALRVDPAVTLRHE